jgi:hypothetical protein
MAAAGDWRYNHLISLATVSYFACIWLCFMIHHLCNDDMLQGNSVIHVMGHKESGMLSPLEHLGPSPIHPKDDIH